MASKLKIRQVKSAIGRHEKQKKTIRALGIRRMHQEIVLEVTPSILGMVKKVEHLLEIEEINE
jgi:large subunit ribosomal protein L30